ncbi:hypothetical protein [Paenarthrobacter sp. NCHU4564]|uniref:hypothetical protein n=1 Tax=Paenarthrobacter sp. NCHU4564 TaxID=3451353 RepID=UPI003F95D047
MTYRDSEREGIVDELLLDADLAGSRDVHQALLSLGSFAHLPAPTPQGELAAMLAGPHDQLSKRRWRNKHRTVVVSAAVVAAMGLGVSGVAAATSGFSRTPAFLEGLVGTFTQQRSTGPVALPGPDAPKVSTEPGAGVDPSALPPAPATTPAPESLAARPAPAAPESSGLPVNDSAGNTGGNAAGNAAGNAVPSTAGGGTPAQGAPAGAAEQGPTQAGRQAPNGTAHNPPGQAARDQAGQHQANPEQAQRDQQKPGKPAAAAKPTASPDKPGAVNKPGPVLPPLTGNGSEQQFQSFVDKLKSWLKHRG